MAVTIIGGLAKATDPDTSHAAAASIDATEMEAVVYDAICLFRDGCIFDDIASMLPDYRIWTISPRIKPLINKGWVIDTGERRKGRSGRSQRVVQATKFVQEG